MRLKAEDLLILFARLAIGGVLIYAGFMKAVIPAAEFAAILEAYKIFPSAFLTPLAIGVPYIEMSVGLFLITGLYTRQAALAATCLFAVFLAVLSSALLRHIDLASCGCFGADTLSPKYTMILDSVLLMLAILTFRRTKLPPALSLDRAVPKT